MGIFDGGAVGFREDVGGERVDCVAGEWGEYYAGDRSRAGVGVDECGGLFVDQRGRGAAGASEDERGALPDCDE